MQKERDLRERTMTFAVAVLRFCRTLPTTRRGVMFAASCCELEPEQQRTIELHAAASPARTLPQARHRHRGGRRIRLLVGTRRSAQTSPIRRIRASAESRSQRTRRNLYTVAKDSETPNADGTVVLDFSLFRPSYFSPLRTSDFNLYFSIQQSAFSNVRAALAAA